MGEGTGSWLANDDPRLRRAWHPVARVGELGEGPLRVWLLGEPWVLVRLAGELRAFQDRCPHRRVPLSLGAVEDQRVLRCAYHGWCFDATGRCVEIPALGPEAALPPSARLVPAAEVASHLGLIWLAPEPPRVDLPEVPEAEDPAFQRGDLPVRPARCSAGMVLDNFLDFAHFPFVHRATFGAEEEREVAPYRPEADDRGVRLRVEHVFANREDPAVARGERPLRQRRAMTYEYRPPFFARLRLDFLDAGGTNTIILAVQPETAERCRIYSSLFRNDLGGDEAAMAEAVDYEVRILEEDLAIQEALDDLRLPLDPQAEVHTRADRITLELRRALGRFLAGQEPGDR